MVHLEETVVELHVLSSTAAPFLLVAAARHMVLLAWGRIVTPVAEGVAEVDVFVVEAPPLDAEAVEEV